MYVSLKRTTHVLILAKCGVAHHAKVSPVVVLADDVPDTAQGGAGVLVNGDLLVCADRLALTCSIGSKYSSVNIKRQSSG